MPNETRNLRDHPVAPSPAERLDSWKEIAAYLKHSERTVRRWENEGLPIHRHAHKRKPAIYAYKPEIDLWWNADRARLEELGRPDITGRRYWLFGLAGACLALVITGAAIYGVRSHIWPRARPPADRIMLVVLPFENLSGDPTQEYFSDGLTEEMISRLGQMEPRRLGIIARTSAVQYKATKKRVDEIGKELGVNYILEGTVRRAADRVRVSAQLIQVSDQTHLWAKSYERDLRDILILQDEIGQAIASEIEITLTPEQQSRFARSAPASPEAHEAYLKGRYYLTRITGRDLQKALEYFQQATEIDPNYALGHAGLAETYFAMNTMYRAPTETAPKARAAAMRALELDQNLAEAHASLGRVRLFYDWDWPGAEKEFLRSLALNQNLPEAHLGYASYLATIGRFEESIDQLRTAYLLDPLSVSSRLEGLTNFYVARRYEETLELCGKIRDLPPDFTEPFSTESFVYAHTGRFREAIRAAEQAVHHSNDPIDIAKAAQAYAESGKKEEARRLLQQILAEARERFVCGYNVATVYAALGEVDRAFSWLQEGIRQRTL
jgi:TolB-like protein/Tfp pilus assembly protein PilF